MLPIWLVFVTCAEGSVWRSRVGVDRIGQQPQQQAPACGEVQPFYEPSVLLRGSPPSGWLPRLLFSVVLYEGTGWFSPSSLCPCHFIQINISLIFMTLVDFPSGLMNGTDSGCYPHIRDWESLCFCSRLCMFPHLFVQAQGSGRWWFTTLIGPLDLLASAWSSRKMEKKNVHAHQTCGAY